MSATWATVIFSSLFAFGLKYFGHSVPESWLAHPRVQRINNLIPIVLLSALVAVNSLANKTHLNVDHRIGGIVFAAIALNTASVPPPAGKPTINLIGRDG